MAYICTNCGLEYVKWQGKCDACKEWNRLASFNTKGNNKRGIIENQLYTSHPKRLDDIQTTTSKRLLSADSEWLCCMNWLNFG